MPDVLTSAGVLNCAHPFPPGLPSVPLLQLTGTPRLSVAGVPVVLEAGVLLPATACPATDGNPAGTMRCLAVTKVLGGAAVRLRVGGQPVLLDTTLAVSDGKPVVPPLPGLKVTVSAAGQSRLRST